MNVAALRTRTDATEIEGLFADSQDLFHEPSSRVEELGLGHELEEVHNEPVLITELLGQTRREVAQLTQDALDRETTVSD